MPEMQIATIFQYWRPRCEIKHRIQPNSNNRENFTMNKSNENNINKHLTLSKTLKTIR